MADAETDVSEKVEMGQVQVHLDRITKPKSLSSTARKVGIALIAAPDPITGIPGVALLASSYALKRRDPANLGHLAQETRKILRDIQSFTL
ncbi:MAG: hypothetical protein OK438_05660 [Thaumarchaeota archaeon]|nr:hypothetical protein [Nitrososphaerota archaeon]